MNRDFLNPWYALEIDKGKQTFYNRPSTATQVYKPKPKSPKTVDPSPKIVYRPALDVIMELTVKIRKDLDGSVPFEWPDDLYGSLCVSWYEEQKKRGIQDIVFLCGDEAVRAVGHRCECCMVCWYANHGVARFIPSQEIKEGKTVPVIKKVRSLLFSYRKHEFTDNAELFKEALKAMADFAPFDGWKKRFNEGLSIMNRIGIAFCGQENTFPIPQPYFRYLLAAQVTQLGAGMGSWFDLPMARTDNFKAVTNRFSAERCKALMYAINNC